jgi:hypothetical protein
MNKQALILAARFIGACAANEEEEGPDVRRLVEMGRAPGRR